MATIVDGRIAPKAPLGLSEKAEPAIKCLFVNSKRHKRQCERRSAKGAVIYGVPAKHVSWGDMTEGLPYGVPDKLLLDGEKAEPSKNAVLA